MTARRRRTGAAITAFVWIGACRGHAQRDEPSHGSQPPAVPDHANVAPAAATTSPVPDGYVRLQPEYCTPDAPPVLVRFARPAGFVPTAPAEPREVDSATWSTPAPGDWLEMQDKHAWQDFVTLEVRCHTDPASWAKEWKWGFVDGRSEHPFAAEPALARLRKRTEVLTDVTDGSVPMLEVRTTYPDGVPRGFIYDNYEGHCWRSLGDAAGDVINIGTNAPVAREQAARARLRSLCSDKR